MAKRAAQEKRKEARRRAQRLRTIITWGVVVVVGGAFVSYLVRNTNLPPQGEVIPTEEGLHIPDGTDPGPYNSDPPTSGKHYEVALPAGFYEPADLDSWQPYPVGHAIHSLEHGYVIFWYNCSVLSQSECDSLKAEIRDFMDSSLIHKLIAFPWDSSDAPLVLTSWGYRLEMPVFDAKQAGDFIRANAPLAPEPDAP